MEKQLIHPLVIPYPKRLEMIKLKLSISHKETRTIHSIEDQKREIGIYYEVRKEYTLLAT